MVHGRRRKHGDVESGIEKPLTAWNGRGSKPETIELMKGSIPMKSDTVNSWDEEWALLGVESEAFRRNYEAEHILVFGASKSPL